MKLKTLIALLLVFALSSIVSADVNIKVDFGNSGTIDSSWTEWSPGGWGDPEGKTIDGVDFTIVGPDDNWRCRQRDVGESDALTKDCVSFEDSENDDPFLTLTITNLPAGNYKILSYHNGLYDWSAGTVVTQTVSSGGSVSGSMPYGQNKENCLQLLSMFSVSGPNDVITIDEEVPSGGMAFFSGFELLPAGALFTFDETESGNFEYVTSAELKVNLLYPQEGATYTVDYAVAGGTAVEGDDFTLGGTGTLTFNPGETSKNIDLNIIDDDLDEEDETVVVELSNPGGPDGLLGAITQHTYTIRDERPRVGFEAPASKYREDALVWNIPVVLSWQGIETVTADYQVTGGTATPGDDYTLAAGTLIFPVGEIVEHISIEMVDDGVAEGDETVQITLSNLNRGVPGDNMDHEFTITDPTFVDMKVDLAVPDYDTLDPIPATAKSGWTIWSDGSWADLYMHDFKGIRDIGGSGIDLCIDGGCEGRSGLKCYDMCMFLLNGGGAPTGSPVGDPIANTWFTSIDRCDSVGGSEGSSQLGIAGLGPGRYQVKLYHNLWDPSGRSGRICTANGYSGHAIEKVHAWSIADAQAWVDSLPGYKQGPAGDAHGKMKSFLTSDVNNTDSITPVVEPTNVMPSTTTNDGGVTTSVVEFVTDGSPVIIFCHSGEWASDQYHGDRAPINAFEIKTIPPQMPTPCDLYEDGTVDEKDLKVFVQNWLNETSGPLNKADFDANGEVNFKDYAILALEWLLSCE